MPGFRRCPVGGSAGSLLRMRRRNASGGGVGRHPPPANGSASVRRSPVKESSQSLAAQRGIMRAALFPEIVRAPRHRDRDRCRQGASYVTQREYPWGDARCGRSVQCAGSRRSRVDLRPPWDPDGGNAARRRRRRAASATFHSRLTGSGARRHGTAAGKTIPRLVDKPFADRAVPVDRFCVRSRGQLSERSSPERRGYVGSTSNRSQCEAAVRVD